MITTPTPQTLGQPSFKVSDKRVILASILAGILAMDFVENNGKEVRKFANATMPMLKLTLGKEVADMLRVVMKPSPDTLELYYGLHLDRFTDEELDYVADYLINTGVRLKGGTVED